MRRISVIVPTFIVALSGAALAAPPTKGRPELKPGVDTPPLTKVITEIEVKNASGIPGETRTFEATLTSRTGGQAPLAGKKVTFRIEGKNGTSVAGGKISAGNATTDASGKARVSFALPELAQGNYALKAAFAGDGQAAGTEGEGNLLMVKTITKVELSKLYWGTYKNEPGPPYGSFFVYLTRTSDNKGLSKPIIVKINGQTQTFNLQGGSQSFPLGTSSPWNVSVQFEGDAANAPSAAQKTYVAPN